MDSHLELTNTCSPLTNMGSELHTLGDGFGLDFKGFSGIAAGGYSVYSNKGHTNIGDVHLRCTNTSSKNCGC